MAPVCGGRVGTTALPALTASLDELCGIITFRIFALDKRIRVDSNELIRAWHLLPYGFRLPRRATISGHARLLARPAYQKLLAAEPLLRRLIPVLILIFLVIVGLARFVELYQLKFEREYEARESL